jgi:nitroreductase
MGWLGGKPIDASSPEMVMLLVMLHTGTMFAVIVYFWKGWRRDYLASTNAVLQAGYFILAARACGLDCGPIGGFDPAKVDAAFFSDGAWRTILPLVNLGHGDPQKTMPRMPRLEFDFACRIA